MDITFWGIRGSIATSGPEFARFGGNTTCLEVTRGTQRIILDAGTGLRALGDKLLREAKLLGQRIRATFFFSHLHWDHIQGFPFFAPAFRPDTSLELFGARDAATGASLEEALRRQMLPPSFPVPLSVMAAEKSFHDLASGQSVERGPFVVRARALCHPQGSLGYRIDAGGKSFCFATDVEHNSEGIDEAILDLARGVDLLAYDAQYTVAEYEGREGPPRKGWGHSTYVAAAEIAQAAGAKALALIHHDPTHDDRVVEAIEREAKLLFPACFAAREGQTVRL
jgi:phosphoribosyl 1,2-cyclic phosphodiesterase